MSDVPEECTVTKRIWTPAHPVRREQLLDPRDQRVSALVLVRKLCFRGNLKIGKQNCSSIVLNILEI